MGGGAGFLGLWSSLQDRPLLRGKYLKGALLPGFTSVSLPEVLILRTKPLQHPDPEPPSPWGGGWGGVGGATEGEGDSEALREAGPRSVYPGRERGSPCSHTGVGVLQSRAGEGGVGRARGARRAGGSSLGVHIHPMQTTFKVELIFLPL